MGPGFRPHEARPQAPPCHSVNPLTAGRHANLDQIPELPPDMLPLESLCASCGDVITLLTRDGAWMHRELQRETGRTV
jgi:hypothetical protein